MAKIREMRWHARAGQGAVTAAKLYAEAAMVGGKHVQAFPEYGPERMGAPIQAFNRTSEEPITIHCHVKTPEIVVVVDDTLLSVVDVTEGLTEDGTVLINTERSPAEVRELIPGDARTIHVLPATRIALDTLGRPIPNTPLLGALAKIRGEVEIEHLFEEIRNTLGKKFTQKVAEGNNQAIRRGYEEVKKI